MKITSTKRVTGYLLEAHEINIPHCGLKCSAKYCIDDIPFVYTVEFWSKHAPVKIAADLVSVRIAEDAPMIWLDKLGKPLRDKTGAVICTRTLVVLCPVKEWKDGKSVYYNGHDPLTIAQRIINSRLLKCKWGTSEDLVI